MVGDAVLGVERSLSGKRWRARVADDRLALMLAQRLGVPEIVGRVLAGREVDPDGADRFLKPTLRDELPDPSRFKDMDRAVERVVQAIQRGERLAVFGDYDVDGATSSALLNRFFRELGIDIAVYIPDRINEGYGPNAPALLKLKEGGAAVVLTVDCGVTAHAPLAAAKEAGLDVIVLDHHVAEPQLPPAVAIVNPNRLDEEEGYGQLAAIGVTFLFVVALNRALRKAGYYGEERGEPDLRQWLDLVALGTVCDVVPLTGLNRAFVTQGLKVMAKRGNPGLAALADISRMKERPGAFHLGYLMGPRVNAGGRVGEADLGARLLASEDLDEVVEIAGRLDRYNEERREIEAAVLGDALAQLDTAQGNAACVVAIGRGWHPGVIGIVASRLRERANRPACVIAVDKGEGKGSGRSIAGVDLGAAVIAARQAGLLVNGGGHKMAAGFTVAEDKVEALAEFLNERVADEIRRHDIVPSLGFDGVLRAAAATTSLVETLETVGPYGAGNPEPRFALSAVRVAKADIVGENHVRAFLSDEDGKSVKAIAFRSAGEPVGDALLNARGGTLHVAGKLRADNWQGRRDVQFMIDDAARTAGDT